jgi:hypothetical protein
VSGSATRSFGGYVGLAPERACHAPSELSGFFAHVLPRDGETRRITKYPLKNLDPQQIRHLNVRAAGHPLEKIKYPSEENWLSIGSENIAKRGFNYKTKNNVRSG